MLSFTGVVCSHGHHAERRQHHRHHRQRPDNGDDLPLAVIHGSDTFIQKGCIEGFAARQPVVELPDTFPHAVRVALGNLHQYLIGSFIGGKGRDNGRPDRLGVVLEMEIPNTSLDFEFQFAVQGILAGIGSQSETPPGGLVEPHSVGILHPRAMQDLETHQGKKGRIALKLPYREPFAIGQRPLIDPSALGRIVTHERYAFDPRYRHQLVSQRLLTAGQHQPVVIHSQDTAALEAQVLGLHVAHLSSDGERTANQHDNNHILKDYQGFAESQAMDGRHLSAHQVDGFLAADDHRRHHTRHSPHHQPADRQPHEIACGGTVSQPDGGVQDGAENRFGQFGQPESQQQRHAAEYQGLQHKPRKQPFARLPQQSADSGLFDAEFGLCDREVDVVNHGEDQNQEGRHPENYDERGAVASKQAGSVGRAAEVDFVQGDQFDAFGLLIDKEGVANLPEQVRNFGRAGLQVGSGPRQHIGRIGACGEVVEVGLEESVFGLHFRHRIDDVHRAEVRVLQVAYHAADRIAGLGMRGGSDLLSQSGLRAEEFAGKTFREHDIIFSQKGRVRIPFDKLKGENVEKRGIGIPYIPQIELVGDRRIELPAGIAPYAHGTLHLGITGFERRSHRRPERDAVGPFQPIDTVCMEMVSVYTPLVLNIESDENDKHQGHGKTDQMNRGMPRMGAQRAPKGSESLFHGFREIRVYIRSYHPRSAGGRDCHPVLWQTPCHEL